MAGCGRINGILTRRYDAVALRLALPLVRHAQPDFLVEEFSWRRYQYNQNVAIPYPIVDYIPL